MAGDPQDWFWSIPFITRYWFSSTVVFTLLGRFGLLSEAWLWLQWTPVVNYFQFWRPVTALFYYPLRASNGFQFLINLYFLYNYSLNLETGEFQGRPADYIFMLIFNWLAAVTIGLFMNVMFLMDPMVLSVLYVWCQLNKDVIVTFWFGTKFKAWYLPWVLFGFKMVVGGGGMSELFGIIIGHLYFFLTYKYPIEFNGPSLISTPQILYKYFPNSYGARSFNQQSAAPASASGDVNSGRGFGFGGGYTWGQGRRLGD